MLTILRTAWLQLAILGLACSPGRGQSLDASTDSKQPQSVTVPLFIENNRPHIDLEFTRPDGSVRRARFILDTGGGGFLMADSLAHDIGLKPSGQELKAEGKRIAPTSPPPVKVGGMPLNLEKAQALILLGQNCVLDGDPAEGMFPGHVLRRYHVVFDYPAGRFTLAQPGTAKPRGVRLAAPIGTRSGFPRIELKIGDETHGFLLDTGATYTMISQELLEHWSNLHPNWKRITGAVGAANMMGGSMETKALMMRLPKLNWGPFQVESVGAVSRPKGVFETYMSRMTRAPVVGALGGNVLRAFRIEIDYAAGDAYVEMTGAIDAHDLDTVGLTLEPNAGGDFVVVNISQTSDGELLNSVRRGDKLLKVDRLEVRGASLAAVMAALRGKPGETRQLTLERDGKPFTVKTAVTRML
jgi:predicted aspartyl protease